MNTCFAKPRFRRNAAGSAIVEFTPTLFVTLVMFAFPLIDLVGLALTYSDCLYLNALLLRQAAMEKSVVLDASQTPAVVSIDQNTADNQKLQSDLSNVVNQWISGFGQFACTYSIPSFSTFVDLSEGSIPANVYASPPTEYIHVNLSCQCKPFVIIPLPLSVPGLNAPVTFSFTGRSMIESVPPGSAS